MPRRSRRCWFALLALAWAPFGAGRILLAQSAPGGLQTRSALVAESEADGGSSADTALPDAPEPQQIAPEIDITLDPGPAGPSGSAGPPQVQRPTTPGFPPVSPTPRTLPGRRVQTLGIPSIQAACLNNLCSLQPRNLCCVSHVDYFQRFLDSTPQPLTARQKGYLALRNFSDPYNLATISFLSGISVASDPHSAYGPGFGGYFRNFGVAYCETAIGEFFGTFLIPAVTHQDPHYHRIPNASVGRRIVHATTQVVWSQSDSGVGMMNYSNLITTAVEIGLGNIYVPGRNISASASTTRYVTAIATAPIGNFISEFLPDVARRINVRVVLIQRIIDRVELENGG